MSKAIAIHKTVIAEREDGVKITFAKGGTFWLEGNGDSTPLSLKEALKHYAEFIIGRPCEPDYMTTTYTLDPFIEALS